MTTELKYLAGGTEWIYPADMPAPLHTKILLLTRGGICVVGTWSDRDGDLAWHPLPKRNKDKEAVSG